MVVRHVFSPDVFSIYSEVFPGNFKAYQNLLLMEKFSKTLNMQLRVNVTPKSEVVQELQKMSSKFAAKY